MPPLTPQLVKNLLGSCPENGPDATQICCLRGHADQRAVAHLLALALLPDEYLLRFDVEAERRQVERIDRLCVGEFLANGQAQPKNRHVEVGSDARL